MNINLYLLFFSSKFLFLSNLDAITTNNKLKNKLIFVNNINNTMAKYTILSYRLYSMYKSLPMSAAILYICNFLIIFKLWQCIIYKPYIFN